MTGRRLHGRNEVRSRWDEVCASGIKSPDLTGPQFVQPRSHDHAEPHSYHRMEQDEPPPIAAAFAVVFDQKVG